MEHSSLQTFALSLSVATNMPLSSQCSSVGRLLANIHKGCAQSPGLNKPGVLARACNPRTWETGAKESKYETRKKGRKEKNIVSVGYYFVVLKL